MNTIKKTIIAAAIAMIPSIGMASSGGEVITVVRQIESLIEMYKEKDSANELLFRPVVEVSEQGEVDVHSYIIPGNVQIAVLGVCDQNCSGFGIKVIDENDRVVGRDNGMDGSNYAEVKGNSSGPESREIRIVGTMSRCSADSCVYGITIMVKPLSPQTRF